MRLVVGISGASGIIYGIRLLQLLKENPNVETHLVISEAAGLTLQSEMGWALQQVEELADYHYDNKDIGARIASGSFLTDGMVILPCSIKTLSSISNCYNSNLMTRAADVTMKEQRKLVLVVRETPLHLGHLKLMTSMAERGAVILPPMIAFYHHPQSIQDIIDQTVGKIMDQFRISNTAYQRWEGFGE